jgi:hypothetical protein
MVRREGSRTVGRDIEHHSEKRMYLRLREIFALADDYDPGKKETVEFFLAIQKKLHFAATRLTAPLDDRQAFTGAFTWGRNDPTQRGPTLRLDTPLTGGRHGDEGGVGSSIWRLDLWAARFRRASRFSRVRCGASFATAVRCSLPSASMVRRRGCSRAARAAAIRRYASASERWRTSVQYANIEGEASRA